MLAHRFMFLLAFSVSSCLGTITPNLDLSHLSKSSDLIVVGYVTDIQKVGVGQMSASAIEADRCIATITPRAFIKGKLDGQPLRVEFYVPHEPMGLQTIQRDTRALIFLGAGADGVWHFPDPYHSLIIGDLPNHAFTSTIDGVLASIEAAVQNKDRSVQERSDALWILSQSDEPQLLAFMKTMEQNPRLELGDIAASYLLAHGDNATLSHWQPRLLQQGLTEEEQALIQSGIRRSSFNSSATPQLENLLRRSPYPLVRSSVAIALKNTDDSSSIPALLAALDDSSTDVQFAATLGLTHLTKAFQLGALEEDFRSHPQKYIRAWKDWAKSNGYAI
jgi:hypothetical protein